MFWYVPVLLLDFETLCEMRVYIQFFCYALLTNGCFCTHALSLTLLLCDLQLTRNIGRAALCVSHIYCSSCYSTKQHLADLPNFPCELQETEVVNLVQFSLPRAPPLYLVSDIPDMPQEDEPCNVVKPDRNSDLLTQESICLKDVPNLKEVMAQSRPSQPPCVSVITELDCRPVLSSADGVEALCYVLPSPVLKNKTSDESPGKNITNACSPEEELPEVTCVTDDIMGLDLMEMDGIDLDAIMEELDENAEEEEQANLLDNQFDDCDVIELYLDVDLNPTRKPDLQKGDIIPDVCSMNDDEYLALGYKKITNYQSNKPEISDYRILQMAHVELFKALGCPLIKSLEKKNVVRYRHRGRRKISHAKATAPIREDSDTDTASEGLSVSSAT